MKFFLEECFMPQGIMFNCTKDVALEVYHIPVPIFAGFCAVLALSLLCNLFCVLSKCCSGKGTCQLRRRRRRSPRQMEDNPIYGNISYSQTDVNECTEADLPPSSLGSSSLRNLKRVYFVSQFKSQDCYANLTIKAPRLNSTLSALEVQHSDDVEEALGSEREDVASEYPSSPVSDLYASVQTPRNKIIDTADDGEDYANHL